MHEEIIKAQEDNSLTVNYNKWIMDNIRPYLGKRVMDVGSGAGNFLGYLVDKELVLAIEILDVFIEKLRRDYGAYNNIHIYKYDIQDSAVVAMANSYKIDTIICNNVLEHIHDDLRALKNMHQILDLEGNLVLVLPAFACLYSKWDRAVGHYRRYDFKDIKMKLAKANFLILRNFYMNSIGFFAWFFNGKILRNTPRRDFLVKEQALFFDRYIVKIIKRLEKIFPLWFGQTLIVIAQPNK